MANKNKRIIMANKTADRWESERKAILMQWRIDPMSLIAKWPKWCKEPCPGSMHKCSRQKGHTGMHFAQYDDGRIAELKAENPWSPTINE